MSMRRSIRNRRGRKRLKQVFDLPLTSMMDIFIIILVFLLKSFSASTHNFTTVPGMQLPMSGSPEMPPDSLYVIVTPEGLTFENERVLDFQQSASSAGSTEATYEFKKVDLDEGGRRIVPLYDALTKAREKAELLRAKSKARAETGEPLPFEGILAIQADKKVRYETLRKIMYTAAAAGFRTFRFLAQRREG
jgi:biopolymer transport protein ExbD